MVELRPEMPVEPMDRPRPPGRVAEPRLDRAALLLVDWQRAFVDGYVPTAPAALERALALADVFRAAGRPVAWTRHAHPAPPTGGGMARFWRSFLLEGSPEAALVAAPAPGEAVFRKQAYSAFRGTRLRAWLRARGVEEVAITGVQTHLCVDATARDAFFAGLDVFVAADACAAPIRHGEDLHRLALTLLAESVARVVPVSAWTP